MTVRLIEAGVVSPLRSQTIYHGLARAWTPDTPDTVVLATPASPYVCVGFHQDIEREVDVGFCARHEIPVLRRELGGGAVYLDGDQLFVQWIMNPDRLPARIDARFERFTRPIIDVYRELGMDARFRPANDIHVDGRKICGTGAARIGDAEVLVGNFLFDFDCARMASILNTRTDAMRRQIEESLHRYMTSMRRELDDVPGEAWVRARYVARCEEALGEPVEIGDLTPVEERTIEEVDRRFRSEEHLGGREGRLLRHGVKIHEDVWVRESTLRSRAGMIHVVGRTRAGRLDDVDIALDGARPRTRFTRLTAALRGVALERTAVDAAVRASSPWNDDATPDVPVDDWVAAIMDLSDA